MIQFHSSVLIVVNLRKVSKDVAHHQEISPFQGLCVLSYNDGRCPSLWDRALTGQILMLAFLSIQCTVLMGIARHLEISPLLGLCVLYYFDGRCPPLWD
jgi:hypothetical protein